MKSIQRVGKWQATLYLAALHRGRCSQYPEHRCCVPTTSAMLQRSPGVAGWRNTVWSLVRKHIRRQRRILHYIIVSDQIA